MAVFIKRYEMTPEQVVKRCEVSARLRTAIIAAQARCKTPRLEAVMTNDGIMIADFYGLRGQAHHSRLGRILRRFDYNEFEEAISFVEAM